MRFVKFFLPFEHFIQRRGRVQAGEILLPLLTRGPVKADELLLRGAQARRLRCLPQCLQLLV